MGSVASARLVAEEEEVAEVERRPCPFVQIAVSCLQLAVRWAVQVLGIQAEELHSHLEHHRMRAAVGSLLVVLDCLLLELLHMRVAEAYHTVVAVIQPGLGSHILHIQLEVLAVLDMDCPPVVLLLALRSLLRQIHMPVQHTRASSSRALLPAQVVVHSSHLSHTGHPLGSARRRTMAEGPPYCPVVVLCTTLLRARGSYCSGTM